MMEASTADWVGHGCRLLEGLTTEILLLIFEDLYKSEGSDGCKPVRLVSKTLCSAVAPFFYRDINFKPKFRLLPVRSHIDPSGDNYYIYGRNARIDCKMNWATVAKFLFRCRQLERLDWAYWDDVTLNRSPIPIIIQDFIRAKAPPVRLYIWRCSIPQLRLITALSPNLSLSLNNDSFPTSNLVGVSMDRPTSRSRDAHEVLAKLVASSPNLESLELSHKGRKFQISQKFPPIKHLAIMQSDWAYTADEVTRIWDFSKLETLKITGWSQAIGFLRSVTSKKLPCLKRLTIEFVRILHNEEYIESLSNFLLDAPNILEIDLTTDLSSLPITSITRHSTLRVLGLRDRIWANGRGEVARMIAIPDLELLQTSCNNLAELTLDVQDCDIFPTLAILWKFRNLRKVSLRIPTRLLRQEENDISIDVDYRSAKEIALYLSLQKEGIPLAKLSVEVGVFNSLHGTCTPEWIVQKAKGHKPERFFIFTWDEAGQLCFEEVQSKSGFQQSIRVLGLAKWLKVHKFPPPD